MSLNKEDIKVDDWFLILFVHYPRKIEEVEFLSDLDNSITLEEDSIIINGYFTFLFKSRGFGNGVEFSKWTPQPNETCIFWNDGDTPISIGKFIKMTKQGNYLCESKFSNELDSPIPFRNIAPITFDISAYGLEG